jgi:hypothetical protein
MGFVARKSAYSRGPERPLNAVHPCKRRQTRPSPGRCDSSRGGVSGTLLSFLPNTFFNEGLRLANTWARQRFLTERQAFARNYTVRRRRLSSITRAPCRKVKGVPLCTDALWGRPARSSEDEAAAIVTGLPRGARRCSFSPRRLHRR